MVFRSVERTKPGWILGRELRRNTSNFYQYSVNAIKSVNKDYRVGGPATAETAWVPEMIQFCHKRTSLDFISTHSYGVEQGFWMNMAIPVPF